MGVDISNNPIVIEDSKNFLEEDLSTSQSEDTLMSTEDKLSTNESTISSTVNVDEIEESNTISIKETDTTEQSSIPEENMNYPSGRSDLSSSQQRFSMNTIPTVNATDVNLPQKSFIDISSHNGSISIESYKIIKSYGVKGVVVKLTEATSYQNPFAKEQISNALAAGLKVSVYHYSWFKTKEQAIQEANYFSAMATTLGLPKDTLMVNDIEEPQIASGNDHTQNSLEFEKRLNQLGFINVNHYVGMHWITSGKINPVALGYTKLWVAAYPYVLDTTQRYTEYGAWQWSSQMKFPNVSGVFDISSDYAQQFTTSLESNQEFNKYVTLNKEISLWSIDNNEAIQIGTTSQWLEKTLRIKKEVQDSTNQKYYLLEDKQKHEIGYIRSTDSNMIDNAAGELFGYTKYVTISAANYTIWENFNWKKRDHSSNYQGEVLQARGYYNHFNGARYLTVYDNQGKWIGYINEVATKLSPNKIGNHRNYGKYVTIKANNYTIWGSFNWEKRDHSSNYQGKVLQARGYYDHFNGERYLTVYDNQGKWIGYINETGVEISDSKVGWHQIDKNYIKITANNYVIWNNFKWQKRTHSSKYQGKVLQVRGYHEHFNGSKFLNLYDLNGKWLGYMNSSGSRNIAQPSSQKMLVTVIRNNYTIWENFNWEKKNVSKDFLNQQLEVKNVYRHANGASYLGLYTLDGKWIGYINETGTNFLNR
nr:glycosyl hydrolase family 25 [Enterococcus sp. DIV2402]